MRQIVLGIFGGKVHVFVDLLDPGGVGLGVIGELDLAPDADALGAPVPKADVDRDAGLAGDEVIACLPLPYRLAGAFNGDCKVEFLPLLHLPEHAADDCARAFLRHRDASQLADQPADDRVFEKTFLDHAQAFPAHGPIVDHGNHKVPD